MKASRKLLAVILALVVGALVAGCGGGGGSAQSGQITLGNIGWDENVALSNLSKVLMQDNLGYNNVQLKTADVGVLFQGVADGDMDAFQDVWLPNHKDYISKVQDQVIQLDPWYQGKTKFGIAVPSYMNITSIGQLNDTNVQQILGIEPGAVISDKIPQSVIPAYNLDQKYVPSSTAAMLSQVKSDYNDNQNFAFIAWEPHWMNQRYDIRYLDDPKNALGDLNDSAKVFTITTKNLPNKDPVAYAFLKAQSLNQDQVNSLEDAINQAGDPEQGARQWAQDNSDVVQPWIDAAKQAQK